MKIGSLHTVYNGRAGIDFFFERMAREIAGLSTDISFKVFCNKEALRGLEGIPRLETVYIKALDNQFSKFVWLEYFSGVVINRKEFDLFWVPSGANSFPGRWNIPVVSTIHDIGEYHFKGKYSFSRMMYRKEICIPRTLKRSTLLVAPSRATAVDVKQTLGYLKEIRVIYEAADPWLESADGLACSQPGGLMPQGEIILSVGRMDFFAKGVDTIVQGYSYLKAQGGKLPPLVFAGPRGQGWQHLEGYIEKHRLRGSVFYLGEVPHSLLQDLYARSVLIVNASRLEGFGIPLLEGMKRGKPVLCSDLKIFQEITMDAPVYFKAGDSGSFKEKLSAILSRKIDTNKHIERGKQIAAGYSWQKAALAYREAFNLALRG